MVRSPLWPIMPNGPAIDGTEEGLLDVPMKLVKQGCLWQNHKNRPNLISQNFAEVFLNIFILILSNLTCHNGTPPRRIINEVSVKERSD